ncbi:hypothetical protein B0H14DRAFT_3455094 [Mycena olivaceomarginata]|nr:hypothetical protein B0H14DRAFT_3455094 [Mycena olivaceomarginata]
MANPRIDDSEAESDAEDIAPARSKGTRASRDDLSANETFESRTRTTRKPSAKQSNNKNLDAANARIAALEKQLLKNRKKAPGAVGGPPQGDGGADNGYESEDNGLDDLPNAAFASSAINSLGRLPAPPPPSAAPLRKATKANAAKTPALSARAFKNLPFCTSANASQLLVDALRVTRESFKFFRLELFRFSAQLRRALR